MFPAMVGVVYRWVRCWLLDYGSDKGMLHIMGVVYGDLCYILRVRYGYSMLHTTTMA